jgi:hypothetical protein
MNPSDKDKLYLVLALLILLLLDIVVAGGVLYKGKANFSDLLKHLKQ